MAGSVYNFPPRDTLLFKAINKHLQDSIAADVSPLCYSFQRGRGIRTAFYALLRDQGIDDKHCLHFDVSDFANSIPVPTLLAGLPSAITADAPLLDLLTRSLCRKEVIRNGR